MNLFFVLILCLQASFIVPSQVTNAQTNFFEDDNAAPFDTSILWGVKIKKVVTFDPSTKNSPISVAALIEEEEPVLQKVPIKITLEWIENEMIPAFKRGVMLPINEINHIISEAQEYFSFDDTIHYVNVPAEGKVIIAGDIHGQFESMLTIFEDFGPPRADRVFIFNGDIVDRGDKSLECILTVFAYKIVLNNSFFVTRGNHESRSVSKGTFYEECIGRLNDFKEAFDMFHAAFDSLPYGFVVRNQIFVTHGGLCPGMDLKVLKVLMRHYFNYKNTYEFYSMLWNDPCEADVPVNNHGLAPNPRGYCCRLFHPTVTIEFLSRYNLGLLVRSHQCVPEGARFSQNGACLTIFSAPNYKGRKNKGAVLVVSPDSQVVESMRL